MTAGGFRGSFGSHEFEVLGCEVDVHGPNGYRGPTVTDIFLDASLGTTTGTRSSEALTRFVHDQRRR